ncbi:hypothetical protein FGG78_27040 [Thioclava sp. BHET1]|nr:hypothetical protein FGG78_27040 [Thioclava sp. BHET1]
MKLFEHLLIVLACLFALATTFDSIRHWRRDDPRYLREGGVALVLIVICALVVAYRWPGWAR